MEIESETELPKILIYKNRNNNKSVSSTRERLRNFHFMHPVSNIHYSFSHFRCAICFCGLFAFGTHTHTIHVANNAARKRKENNLQPVRGDVDVTQHQWLPTDTMRRQTKKVTEFTFCSTWIRSPPLALCVQCESNVVVSHSTFPLISTSGLNGKS